MVATSQHKTTANISTKLHSHFTLLNSTEPFHQRLCWSGSGRLSPHNEEKLTAVRGCSRFPWQGNCRWWGRRASTLQHCVTRVHGTSYASPDCWLAWCSWRAPNPGRSLSALHSTLHSGCSPAHAVSHLDTEKATCSIWSNGDTISVTKIHTAKRPFNALLLHIWCWLEDFIYSAFSEIP